MMLGCVVCEYARVFKPVCVCVVCVEKREERVFSLDF